MTAAGKDDNDVLLRRLQRLSLRAAAFWADYNSLQVFQVASTSAWTSRSNSAASRAF